MWKILFIFPFFSRSALIMNSTELLIFTTQTVLFFEKFYWIITVKVKKRLEVTAPLSFSHAHTYHSFHLISSNIYFPLDVKALREMFVEKKIPFFFCLKPRTNFENFPQEIFHWFVRCRAVLNEHLCCGSFLVLWETLINHRHAKWVISLLCIIYLTAFTSTQSFFFAVYQSGNVINVQV